ncbi:MAG: Imm19 family immunity protein [Ruminococcus flavefaciens]|nr:Imm19 family immunity protein [Ruminococcus flavefaciens]
MYSANEIMNNTSFWYYFLSVNFPNAYDETTDTDISEIIEEYSPDNDWIDEFVQYSDEIFNQNDGYVDNPNTIELNLNGHDFKIEFHAGDTVYFLDGQQIGCTGGHFILGKIDFQLFSELTHGIADKRIFLLVMPMVSLKDTDIPNARNIIRSALGLLKLKKEHINKITDMITDGLSI